MTSAKIQRKWAKFAGVPYNTMTKEFRKEMERQNPNTLKSNYARIVLMFKS